MAKNHFFGETNSWDSLQKNNFELKMLKLLENHVKTKGWEGFLHMNAKKTQFMVYNQPTRVEIHTVDGSCLEEVKDFKYLGSWVQSTKQDIKVRKAMAWKACNKLTKIWKSTLSRNLKIKLFHATVESVLLYGCGT